MSSSLRPPKQALDGLTVPEAAVFVALYRAGQRGVTLAQMCNITGVYDAEAIVLALQAKMPADVWAFDYVGIEQLGGGKCTMRQLRRLKSGRFNTDDSWPSVPPRVVTEQYTATCLGCGDLTWFSTPQHATASMIYAAAGGPACDHCGSRRLFQHDVMAVLD